MVYVRIVAKGLRSFGGYILVSASRLRPARPRVSQRTQDHAERRAAEPYRVKRRCRCTPAMSRRYASSSSRLLPGQLHHLVDQNNGSFPERRSFTTTALALRQHLRGSSRTSSRWRQQSRTARRSTPPSTLASTWKAGAKTVKRHLLLKSRELGSKTRKHQHWQDRVPLGACSPTSACW